MQLDNQVRIFNALDALVADPTGLNIKPLKGRPEFRLRGGKYRILFLEDPVNQVYIVTQIRPRGDVYK